MTLRAFVIAYPWDLLDTDLNVTLDRLHGEIGVTGVSVWMTSPSLLQVRAKEALPWTFHTQGGLFFAPDDDCYATTRCKPVLSSWARGRNVLARIAEACTARAIELRVIVSAAATGRLAQRHPEMACKNAFGDESQFSVCLANSDVQTYLRGLVSDLSSNYHISGLTLADFGISWQEGFAADLRLPAHLHGTDRYLLSICFCESCQQRAGAAGVDVATARGAVLAILRRRLEDVSGSDRKLDEILGDNAALAAFHQWRAAELSGLLARLVTSCPRDLLLDRGMHQEHSSHHQEPDLTLPWAVITPLDPSEELPSTPSTGAHRNELRLSEAAAAAPFAPRLVRTLSHAVEIGYSGVHIDNYGLLPESALTVVKQAIRFARRSTGD